MIWCLSFRLKGLALACFLMMKTFSFVIKKAKLTDRAVGKLECQLPSLDPEPLPRDSPFSQEMVLKIFCSHVILLLKQTQKLEFNFSWTQAEPHAAAGSLSWGGWFCHRRHS